MNATPKLHRLNGRCLGRSPARRLPEEFGSPGIEIPPHIRYWVALRRVRGHRVLCVRTGQYVDSGHPVPEYVRTALSELLDRGHVRLGDRRQDERSPVEVTESGDELFVALDSPGGLA